MRVRVKVMGRTYDSKYTMIAVEEVVEPGRRVLAQPKENNVLILGPLGTTEAELRDYAASLAECPADGWRVMPPTNNTEQRDADDGKETPE